MKKLIVSMFLVFTLLAVNIGIAAAEMVQQDKMKSCNKVASAKALKGDKRKAFMKSCLSGRGESVAPAATKMTQQDKMKTCNKLASERTFKINEERKAFMSYCLKMNCPGCKTRGGK